MACFFVVQHVQNVHIFVSLSLVCLNSSSSHSSSNTTHNWANNLIRSLMKMTFPLFSFVRFHFLSMHIDLLFFHSAIEIGAVMVVVVAFVWVSNRYCNISFSFATSNLSLNALILHSCFTLSKKLFLFLSLSLSSSRCFRLLPFGLFVRLDLKFNRSHNVSITTNRSSKCCKPRKRNAHMLIVIDFLRMNGLNEIG